MAIIVSRAASANAQNVMPTSTIILQTMPTYTPATSESLSSALSSFFSKLLFSCSIITLSFIIQYVYPL
nr:MAG TPA: hypothetical protein [Caudoviricetes sp.]DAX31619.1 MAG TPA: hypothetical protein [Caudoviricetes sp.]